MTKQTAKPIYQSRHPDREAAIADGQHMDPKLTARIWQDDHGYWWASYYEDARP